MSVKGITKRQLIEAIESQLTDTDRITIDFTRGIMRDETQPGPFVKATPTGTTIVIHINGGAVNMRKTWAGTMIDE